MQRARPDTYGGVELACLHQAAAAELVHRLRPETIHQYHHTARPFSNGYSRTAPARGIPCSPLHRAHFVPLGIEHDDGMWRLEAQAEPCCLLAEHIVYMRLL